MLCFLINSCSQLVSFDRSVIVNHHLHVKCALPEAGAANSILLQFLHPSSLKRLVFLPDHLCRFGVRFDVTDARGFSRKQVRFQHRKVPRHHASCVKVNRISYLEHTPHTLKTGTTRRPAIALRPPSSAVQIPSTGILTCFPSTTLFRPSLLGVDSPCPD